MGSAMSSDVRQVPAASGNGRRNFTGALSSAFKCGRVWSQDFLKVELYYPTIIAVVRPRGGRAPKVHDSNGLVS